MHTSETQLSCTIWFTVIDYCIIGQHHLTIEQVKFTGVVVPFSI